VEVVETLQKIYGKRIIIMGGGAQVGQVAIGAVSEADRHNIRGEHISVDTIPLVGEQALADAVRAVARLPRAKAGGASGRAAGDQSEHGGERPGGGGPGGQRPCAGRRNGGDGGGRYGNFYRGEVEAQGVLGRVAQASAWCAGINRHGVADEKAGSEPSWPRVMRGQS
jgi:hypothetical protein